MVTWGIAAICLAASAENRPIILISVDTLRADHLSSYGYSRLKTSRIDSLAIGGTIFSQASAQVPLTLPSHTSLLTSTYPFTNGVRDNGEQVGGDLTTLASILKSRGYRTSAFVGGFVLDRRFGLDRGFDTYDSPFKVEGEQGVDSADLKRPAEEVTESAIRWIDANATQPFFVMVHLFDLHTPYILPAAVRAKFPDRGYDGALSYIDDNIGRLLGFLEKKGLLQKSLIVFLADHGESLGDHGERTHGYFVYQSTLRVPLIFHWPAGAGFPTRLDQPVGLVDVAPSILDFLGAPRPAQFQGRSLLNTVRQNAPAAEHEVYGESLYAHDHLGCAALLSLRVGKYKYIDAPKPELYDLSQDPDESSNVFQRQKTEAIPLRKRLQTIRSLAPAANQAKKQASPDVIRRLSSLGYLASTTRLTPLDSGADPKDKIADYEVSRKAIVLAMSGQPAEAVAMFDGVLSRNPEFLDARNIMGLTQQKLGKHEDAIRSFHKVLERDPLNLLAHYNTGVSYMELDQLDAAVKELEVAVAIATLSGRAADQVTAPAEELLGRILLQKKEYERARGYFEQLLKIAPDNFVAHYNLGWLATMQSKWDDGERHLQAAIKADGANPTAHDALGNLYLKRGDLDRARGELQEAIRLNAKDAWGHYSLGIVFARKNQNEQAASEFRQALDADSTFTQARSALERLEKSKK